ncbi:MAG: DUF5696 domain-containing protein, partial [Clostridia bacterium]|nr:DUF5696 domain-containing protein [Clostridia bacterium]
NKVESIDLLPFFGAAYKDQEGYLFVPDGSGALIYNNNNRLTAKTYEKALYGFDNGTSDKISGSAKATSATSENQYMPIFGASVDDYGYLAIVTDGAARGTIKANVSGKYTSYNAVWSKFSYRIVGSVNQTQKDGSDRIANIYEHNMELNHDYTVTYKFLEKGKNTYSDMANLYRDYLIKTNGLESRVVASDKIPFYLNTYGYIVKTKSFLGIPTDTKIATSTIKDVEAMLDILDENDIKNVVLKYDYWSKNSYFDKLPTSASVENKVGSKKEMLSLKERLEQSGGALYLSVDLMNAYKTGNGVSSYSDVLKSVANTVLRQFVLKISDSTIDTRYGAWYLIRPSRLSTYYNKYLKNTQKVGYDTLSFDTIGSYLYSELSSDGTGRNFSLKIIKDLIGSIEERTNGLMVTGANEYVASFASHILDTSFRNSGYDLEDVSIPFYQMVFHGYVSYSIGASNLASEPNIRTLKCIEYGAYPQFTVIKENADEIIGSRVDNIFSPDFNNWSDFMHTQYVQVNEALEDVQNATVKSHEFINNDVVKIVYSNGTTIYVNYGSNDAAIASITVPATGYYVIKSNGKTVSNVALSD